MSIPDSALTFLNTTISSSLSGNALSGAVPSWIQRLAALNFLDLSSNRLSGTPVLPPRATQHYNLSLNMLSGDVPDFDQTDVRVLDLSGNRLSGGVPRLPKVLEVVWVFHFGA
jgi:Leucine-rich repeat (LRR) protein